MTNSIIFSNNLKQVMKRFIFLVVLLSSVNALAETRVIPVYGTAQVNDKVCNVTEHLAVDACKAVKRERSANRESSNSNARRVSVDEFERVLGSVTKPQQREMVWLSQRNQAD